MEKLFESGVIETEEDAYWLGVALDAAHNGVEPDLSDDEDDEDFTEKHPLYHTSGAWRAEGWKKIPQVAKSVYLPQRNQAQVTVEDASASTGQAQASGLTSGRTARVTGRRLAHDMETTRKTTIANTAESDLFAFNQLRIRKKQLRFARSAIEGYGLYAMETIQPNEMICEYVGELCRQCSGRDTGTAVFETGDWELLLVQDRRGYDLRRDLPRIRQVGTSLRLLGFYYPLHLPPCFSMPFYA